MAAGKKTGKRSQASNDFLVPSPVTSLSVTDVGASRPYLATAVAGSAASVNGTGGAFTVSWTSSGPNTATSFDVSTTPFIYTVNVNSSPYTFQGLASNTEYTVSVVARNAEGASNPTTSSSVLSTTVPETVSTPTATAGVNQNSIAFSTPANGGKAISGYKVNGSDGTSNTGSSSPITVADQAGTSQNYTVTATNANGDSIVSQPSNNVTTQSPSFFAPPSFFGPPTFFAPPSFFAPPFFDGCINADTKIYTTSGYKMAKDIKISDTLIGLSFDQMPNEGEYDPNTWSSNEIGKAIKINAKIFSIQETLKDKTFMINKNVDARFSIEEEILVLRDNIYKFVTPLNIELGDKIVYVLNETPEYIEVNSIDEINEISSVYRFYTKPDVLVLGESFIIRN